MRRLFIWGSTLLALAALVVAAALVNNNYSLRHTSRSEFRAQVDHAIDVSTTWMAAHPSLLANPSLLFMVADMEKMSGDPRLREILNQYRHSKYITNPKNPFGPVWLHMIDSTAPVPRVDLTWVPANDVMEVVWQAHAVAPGQVLISPAQHDNMFSRTMWWWGARQHQLLSLDMYRYYNGGSPSLDSTINYLAEKVARDAYFDVRVNDSYGQRSAFILMAGRPDLVRPRWIERVLSHQSADGHWNYCWYHWCKGVFEFSAHDLSPDHATTQTAWLLYLLKYRFSGWIDEHYH